MASNLATQELKGTVKTVTLHNEENGYFIVKVTTADKQKETTVIGYAPTIVVGEQIAANGVWGSNPRWGPQFKANHVILSQPKELAGIEKYLVSSVPNVGKGFAKKLVDAFGEDLFRVIKEEPHRLSAVKGVGKARAESMVAAIEESESIRKIMVFMHKHGLSAAKAKRVHEIFGDKAVERLNENPYELVNIWGIGFKIADEFAKSQGIEADSEYRVRAGIIHLLNEASSAGSVGLPREKLVEDASLLLNAPFELIESCIELESMAGGLVVDHTNGVECLFLPKLYSAEKYIAQRLVELHKKGVTRPIEDIEYQILEAEMGMGISLAEGQREAAHLVLSSQVSVLTGGPGTGKTTITKAILTVLDNAGLRIAIAAPTGKAAKRATEATGFKAGTIHRLLEYGKGGKFKYNENNPIDFDVLFLDESSMLDILLTQSTLKALPKHARIVLIGDVDQLPSVGPGKVLADVIDSKVLPVARLTEVFRQAKTSKIISAAHAVNQGYAPGDGFAPGSDFGYLQFNPHTHDDELAKRQARDNMEIALLDYCKNAGRYGFDPIRDVQVLTPMRNGQLGVVALNNKLQALLNPRPSAFLEWNGVRWGIGDKVMQLRNNYDKNITNGEQGFIVGVNTAEKIVSVEFDLGLIEYKLNELDELTLAYALTIHKSQGSEFPMVVMPVDTSHWVMLKRNLVYTGITRAKKMMVLLANKNALQKALANSQMEERYSKLKDWIQLSFSTR